MRKSGGRITSLSQSRKAQDGLCNKICGSVTIRSFQFSFEPPLQFSDSARRAFKDSTGATGATWAPKCTDRRTPSMVLFRIWRPPRRRSRLWMRSFPGCEVRASPTPGGGSDLLRFVGPMMGKSPASAIFPKWDAAGHRAGYLVEFPHVKSGHVSHA
jgi:hypothetical protein